MVASAIEKGTFSRLLKIVGLIISPTRPGKMRLAIKPTTMG